MICSCAPIPNEAPDFNMFSTKISKARVIDVYDGDTITCIIKKYNQFVKIKCRLIGIDTPEMRGGTNETKQLAHEARDFLSSLVLNNIIYIKCDINDKYGRVLVVIFLKNPVSFYKKNVYVDEYFDKSINKIILNKNMGIPYYGGKKYI
jgi:endonuclease YncB( thermonuclease family)